MKPSYSLSTNDDNNNVNRKYNTRHKSKLIKNHHKFKMYESMPGYVGRKFVTKLPKEIKLNFTSIIKKIKENAKNVLDRNMFLFNLGIFIMKVNLFIKIYYQVYILFLLFCFVYIFIPLLTQC